MRANTKEVDMIHGPLLGKMIAFTIPVILSGVYNFFLMQPISLWLEDLLGMNHWRR